MLFNKHSKTTIHGTSVYTFYKSSYKTFSSSKEQCQRFGAGFLTGVKSKDVQELIEADIKEYESSEGNQFRDLFWIGLKLDGAWKWEEDGASLGEYEKWYPGEPNYTDRDLCAGILTKSTSHPDQQHNPVVVFGYWGNVGCGSKNGYICENGKTRFCCCCCCCLLMFTCGC